MKKACDYRPNCVHGLGYHKKVKSIWAEKPPHLASLGPDPALTRRSPGVGHAGLKNLGALCYMNTLFQCLFMNAHFRYNIYKFRSQMQIREMKSQKRLAAAAAGKAAVAESKADGDDAMDVDADAAAEDADRIVCELQSLFARLEFGRASFEDPCRIVSSLRLAPGEQQDVNEFNNLFLNHLEARLKLTGTPGVATLIDDEFKGTIVHAITCEKCGTRSENSTSFYDLTLQIAKLKTVQQCLVTHMRKEELDDSNKYKCSSCTSLQNAVRSTVIKELPPVLNLQLLRFAYDPERDTKKKLLDNISIPAKLDMAPFMDEKQIDQLSQELILQQAAGKAGAAAASAAAAAAGVPILPRIDVTDLSGEPPSSPARRGRTHPPSSPARSAGAAAADAAAAGGSAAAAAASSPHQYELTAILRHKGMSAHHGHYIADIRDPADPTKWWRFDDDRCTPLTQFDDASAPTVALDVDDKPKKGGKKKGAQGGAKKKKKKIGSDDEDEDDNYEDTKSKPKGKAAAASAAAAAAAAAKDDEESGSEGEEQEDAGHDAESPVVIDIDEAEEGGKKAAPPAAMQLDK